MANRKKARRARSRKPRPQSTPVTTAGEAKPPRQTQAARGAAAKRPAARSAAAAVVAPTLGERPRAPWHPLPLAELLIVVGAIGAVVGLRRGVSHGGPPLFAGLVAVGLGTIEVTLREHRGGYRSHTLILSLLPVVVFHSVVVLAITAFTRIPPILNLALLAIDLAVFAFCFKVMRARFLEARHARALGGTGGAGPGRQGSRR